eukprot:2105801-Pleurochrysis_carterae.AAC.2
MSSGDRTEADTTTLSADATKTSAPAGISHGCAASCFLSTSYVPMRTAHAGIIERAAGSTPR